ncbi:hypothetical protein Taro_036973 [Colocasia esculenta]|uniref:Uncharacterized protein n=1 Tax=Colocasia esculenta TaxID=4460 RepID=A0A843WNA6_COLES|nr:hypothetical protein [Colocasia esculenta]
MGRSPCCDKVGVKKGPWTPEEDIILVTYIQEHGPGNWRAVPANAGLRRCSKSCRLRWTNYLRPGIKRGNFTDKEEKLIIHLQALLGNRWAAIATYLPERTDNDIKNYWNTHLRKKLRKQCDDGDDPMGSSTTGLSHNCRSLEKGQWERRLQTDIHMAKQALRDALSMETPSFMSKLNHLPPAASSDVCKSASTQGPGHGQCPHPVSPSTVAYASSADNISRLLQGWTTSNAQKPLGCGLPSAGRSSSFSTQHSSNSTTGCGSDSSYSEGAATTSFAKDGTVSSDALESLLDFGRRTSTRSESASGTSFFREERKQMPLSMLETWLLDEGNISTQPVPVRIKVCGSHKDETLG